MSASFTPLGAVAEFINGAAFKPTDWGEDGDPIIRIQNLTDPNKPFNRTRRHVSDKIRVWPGDLLVSWSATLGVFEWAGPEVAVLNQHIFRVIPDTKKVNRRYLRYAVKQALLEMEQHLHGATMKHVNRAEFLGTRIFLPPLPEQRRIAEVLDRAEALRAKRRAALAELDGLVQAVFLNMFGNQQTILARWPTTNLGEVLDFLTSGSRGWATHYAESGDPFLRIQNVQRDALLLDDIAFVQAPVTAEARRTRVESGDVLLSITADLGRVAAVPAGLGRAFINQHLAILRTRSLAPRFLSAYLASPQGQVQVLGRNRQGVKAGLNFDDIRSIVVPVVPDELQHEFTRRAAAIDRLKAAQRASLAELDALFASLQHRAFRGEL